MANWYLDSTSAGGGDGTTWTLAFDTLAAAVTAAAAGDTIWVAHTHAETTGSAITITDIKGTFADPLRIICANKAGTVPPVAADLRTTATVTTTGASNIAIASSTASRTAYFYGITFNAGTGAVTATFSLGIGASNQIMAEQCSFRMLSTNFNAMTFGAPGGHMFLKNCTMQFGATNQNAIFVSAGVWDGGSILGATIPATLFSSTGMIAGPRTYRNFDFSALGSGKSFFNAIATRASFIFENCKIDALATIVSTRSTSNGGNVTLIRTDSAETGYRTAIMGEYSGDMTTSVTVVRTGGASDGVTPVAWKFETTANAEWMAPFVGLPLWKFNDTIDEAIDITVEGVGDPRHFTALPTNKEFWIEVSYQGTSGSALGLTTGSAGVLDTGTAHTASTEAWDSAATARANSTAYALGDVIKVASNAGRIFICTTAGTTAGSEPGGYASAVDGGSVTDNTATFKAGWRFKQTIAVTPVAVGAIQALPKMAKVSSVVYLDPKLVIPLAISLLTDSVGGLLSSGVDFLLAS